MARVEGTSDPVLRLDVHAHPESVLCLKPSRQHSEQFGSHTGSPVGWNDIKVLELTVATVALCEMAGDICHYPVRALGKIHHSRP
jgi:hypothetical protein